MRRSRPISKNGIVGSVNAFVKPAACTPFAKQRSLIPRGVSQLMAHLDNEDDDEEHGLNGLALGPEIPMVLKLERKRLHYARNHFVSMCI